MDQGKIIYTLISRDVTVLAEFADATGNFTQISRDVINRIDAYTSRKMRCAYNVLYSYSSYAYNDTIHFHIMVEAGLIFLCMADASFVKRRAYAFLIDIRNLFIQKFGSSWQSAIAYAMNAQFSRILADRAVAFIFTCTYYCRISSLRIPTATNFSPSNMRYYWLFSSDFLVRRSEDCANRIY
jgi:vesicle-associated membrane protein 7